MIQAKRAYEAKSENDGARFLVERLWPRGVKKESLDVEGWLKDVAPSAELRRWFNHDPKKWDVAEDGTSSQYEPVAECAGDLVEPELYESVVDSPSMRPGLGLPTESLLCCSRRLPDSIR